MPFVYDVCPRVLSYYDRRKMISAEFYLLPSIRGFPKYQAHVFYLTIFGIRCFCSNRSMALETKAEESQCCQEINCYGEVMEPADNTERFKKNLLNTIFSANSGPSNLC